MERIKKLLEHIIQSAQISGDDDIVMVATVLHGSIEQNCVCELANVCEQFTEKKVEEIMFIKKIEQMIREN